MSKPQIARTSQKLAAPRQIYYSTFEPCLGQAHRPRGAAAASWSTRASTSSSPSSRCDREACVDRGLRVQDPRRGSSPTSPRRPSRLSSDTKSSPLTLRTVTLCRFVGRARGRAHGPGAAPAYLHKLRGAAGSTNAALFVPHQTSGAATRVVCVAKRDIAAGEAIFAA